MSAKPKLFVVETDHKPPQQLAKEAVADYRERQRALTVAESYHHRCWCPAIVVAFMQADVIKGVKLTQAMIDQG